MDLFSVNVFVCKRAEYILFHHVFYVLFYNTDRSQTTGIENSWKSLYMMLARVVCAVLYF